MTMALGMETAGLTRIPSLIPLNLHSQFPKSGHNLILFGPFPQLFNVLPMAPFSYVRFSAFHFFLFPFSFSLVTVYLVNKQCKCKQVCYVMDDDTVVGELFRLTKFGSATIFLEYIQTHFISNDNWGLVRQRKSGNTVAYVAAECGHVSILSLCRDVDLERANRDGKRPLHIAAQASHVDCVDYLVSRHVDVDCFKRADWYAFCRFIFR
jgi:Ankyrin repeats (3 copies)